MLTNHFYPLSKPVSPMDCCRKDNDYFLTINKSRGYIRFLAGF